MEWLQDPVLLPIICFITPFFIFMLWRDWHRKAPFPPGPPKLPIIGNMLIMGELTHRGLAALAERYGGLLYLRLGFVHAFAVSTPEMARQVLQVLLSQLYTLNLKGWYITAFFLSLAFKTNKCSSF